MPDLAELIRERLDDPKRYMESGIDLLIDALLAVVDLHQCAEDGRDYTRGRFPSVEEPKYDAGRRWGLRDAAKAIAKELGIEVE